MEGDDPARPRCDCGYVCEGESDDQVVADAQRHAREVHGIEVSREQILSAGRMS